MNPHEPLRQHLLKLESYIQKQILASRTDVESMSQIAAETEADTIYQIDKVSEEAILEWFEHEWPGNEPIQVVMEGVEEDDCVTFPKKTPVEKTKWKCILDPIDGTRGIMYDKRSAWILGGIAPQRGKQTNLTDIVVAAMTELPTTKQWRADQISAIRGMGTGGIHATMHDVRNNTQEPLKIQPSRAKDFRHGFAALARFFPDGKSLCAGIEEKLWKELYGKSESASPLIFDDQYISTGGQIYEILIGHDRMQGDLRPLLFESLGITSSLVCHPYDACTSLVLTESGGVFEHPLGGPVQAPLDTISPVSWMAYPSEFLAAQVRPILIRLLDELKRN